MLNVRQVSQQLEEAKNGMRLLARQLAAATEDKEHALQRAADVAKELQSSRFHGAQQLEEELAALKLRPLVRRRGRRARTTWPTCAKSSRRRG